MGEDEEKKVEKIEEPGAPGEVAKNEVQMPDTVFYQNYLHLFAAPPPGEAKTPHYPAMESHPGGSPWGNS